MPVLADHENMAIELMAIGGSIQTAAQSNAPLISRVPAYDNVNAPEVGVRFSQDQLTASREFVDLNRTALDGIAVAAGRQAGAYPISWKQNPAIGTLLPQLSMHRAIVRLLAVAALLSAHDGLGSESVARLTQAAAADRALRHEPILVSMMVRMKSQSLVYDSVLRCMALTPFNEEQLRALDVSLASFVDDQAIRAAMMGERVVMLDTITWAYSGGDLSGLVARGMPPGALLKLAPGLKSADAAAYLEQMARICEAVRMPPAMAVAEVAKIEQRISGLPFYAMMAKMLTPAMSRSVTLWYRSRAQIAATRAALAAERFRTIHGEWPTSLKNLVPGYVPEVVIVDPFSGMPLIYHHDADGIRIYSVGEDGIDDGGVMDREQSTSQRTMFDPGVFLPNPELRNRAASTQATEK